MDGRFYILSLASVFLALALGILLGVHLPGAEALLVSEEILVSRLEREFTRVNEERMALQMELDGFQRDWDKMESRIDDLLLLAIEGRLDDVHISLSSESYLPGTHFVNLLEIAGASVQFEESADVTQISVAVHCPERQQIMPGGILKIVEGEATFSDNGREIFKISDITGSLDYLSFVLKLEAAVGSVRD